MCRVKKKKERNREKRLIRLDLCARLKRKRKKRRRRKGYLCSPSVGVVARLASLKGPPIRR
jgi:hypothetical protein